MPAKISDLNTIVAGLIQSGVYLVGIVVVLMFLWGGYEFIISAGEKEGTQRAWRILNYALRGLILAVAAWVILNLLANFFGIPNLFSDFSICLPGQTC